MIALLLLLLGASSVLRDVVGPRRRAGSDAVIGLSGGADAGDRAVAASREDAVHGSRQARASDPMSRSGVTGMTGTAGTAGMTGTVGGQARREQVGAVEIALLVALGIVASVLGLTVLHAGPLGTLIALVLALLWVVAERRGRGPRPVAWRWALMLALVGIATAQADAVHVSAIHSVLGVRAALSAGVLLLLTTPANDAVAAVLRLARGPSSSRDTDGGPDEAGGAAKPAAPVTARPAVMARAADTERPAVTERPADAAAGTRDRAHESGAGPAESAAPMSGASTLHGGRWIGPLERILLVLLSGAGAQAALAAIIAAKGVIRFPEISQDPSGRKAEEFLIGSLASWSLAVLGSLLMGA